MNLNLTVLVADDSALMRRLLIRTVNRSGIGSFDFVEASNGAEALDVVGRESIDLVFTDWHMPGMGGAGFVRGFRAAARRPDAPVVVVSSDREAQAAVASGEAAYFIAKPPTDESVARALAIVLTKVGPLTAG